MIQGINGGHHPSTNIDKKEQRSGVEIMAAIIFIPGGEKST